MAMKKTVIFVLLAAWGIYYWHSNRPITYEGRGQIVQEQPVQKPASKTEFRFKEKYTMIPLADFAIRARVLSSERYRFDDASELAPVDLLLGWGVMSDDQILSALELSQGSRWFFWHCKTLPVAQDQIEHNAANMHLIPENDAIESAIKKAKTGNLVKFKGYLVKVIRNDGWQWQSSLTRNDTGSGACEVVFVTNFAIVW
jgi:hypothetical protein